MRATTLVFLAFAIWASQQLETNGTQYVGVIETTRAGAPNQQSPPLPFFDPFRTPWDGLVVMPEDQSLVIGEIVVDCLPDTGAPVFELLPPTPSFVRIVPSQCACLNQLRAKVIVTPRFGDKGKYAVRIAAGGCGSAGGAVHQEFTFAVRVKKAV